MLKSVSQKMKIVHYSRLYSVPVLGSVLTEPWSYTPYLGAGEKGTTDTSKLVWLQLGSTFHLFFLTCYAETGWVFLFVFMGFTFWGLFQTVLDDQYLWQCQEMHQVSMSNAHPESMLTLLSLYLYLPYIPPYDYNSLLLLSFWPESFVWWILTWIKAGL